jgi:putative SOS response-associated peptidase YedK
MCGRFALKTPVPSLREAMHFDNTPAARPRYNIAPSQEVLVVRLHGRTRQAEWMRWGLIPHWAKDPDIGRRMINARAETVTEKPAYRDSFQRRRCLIPADGFYEWQAVKGRGKQPHFLRRTDGRPIAFAGLWDEWSDPAGRAIRSCTIITVDAVGPAARVHHRMPAVLPEESWPVWLNADTDAEELMRRLLPPADLPLEAYPVDKQVNSPENDSPALIEPTDADDAPASLF